MAVPIEERAVKKFVEYLKIAGYRVTPERCIIAETAYSIEKHFDAEDLVEAVKSKHISRATTYRTLQIMIKAGVIKRALRRQGRGEYERAIRWEPHGHLTCTNCGRVEEFKEGIIHKLRHDIFPKYKFEPIEYRINIFGWCKKCTAKREKDEAKKLAAASAE